MTTSTCVYCRGGGPFDREHVVAKSFTTRVRDNLTLAPGERPAVCRSCNEYFGKTIDLRLGRSSYEASLKFLGGRREPQNLDQLSRALTVRLPPDSPLGELRLRYVPARPGGTGLAVEPVPQVTLKKDGVWYCFDEDELAELDAKEEGFVGSEGAVYCSESDGDETRTRLLDALAAKGIRFKKTGPLDMESFLGDGVVDTIVGIDFNGLLARAIAKIAFNYFVYVTYQNFPALSLDAAFDGVRDFIRNGVGDWRCFVSARPGPPLVRLGSKFTRISGHVVRLDWERGSNTHIHCVVCLFGAFVYGVLLCPQADLVWRDIGSGHHWNLAEDQVEELPSSTWIEPPPGMVLP